MEDNLKNLSPEERIKRLKEIEEKKRKEIAEAQELLKESEKDLLDKEELIRKIPIPQVAKDDLSEMSEAEKEVVGTHRKLKEKRVGVVEGEGKEEDKVVEKVEGDLEEAVEREKIDLPLELMQSDYAQRLSQEPMGDIYQGVKEVYDSVKEKGYVSSEEARKVEYLMAGTERKLEDSESGDYSLTEKVAKAAMLTERIGVSVMGMYKRNGDKVKEKVRDSYN